MKSDNEKNINERKALEEKVKRCYMTNEVLEIIKKYNLDKEVKGEDKYVKTN